MRASSCWELRTVPNARTTWSLRNADILLLGEQKTECTNFCGCRKLRRRELRLSKLRPPKEIELFKASKEFHSSDFFQVII